MQFPALNRSVKAVRKALGFPIASSGVPVDWPFNWWQQGNNAGSSGKNITTQACISAYAETMAILWPAHYRYSPDNEKTRVRNSAVAKTLRHPNPYQTRSDFMLNLVSQLFTDGNAYAIGYRNEREQITEMHLLQPGTTTPYIDPETKAVFYAIGSNPFVSVDYLVPARDILHVKLYTPRHPLIGVSPIVNTVMAMAANNAITAHQSTFFNNMRRPSGVLSSDMELTAVQMTQLRTAWDAQSKDLNSGGVPILGYGMKWQPMSVNSQDAQLAQAFNMSVEDIARAFRVPLPLVGDLRYGTYNNVEHLISTWLSMGLGFVLEHIELALDKFFDLADNDNIEFDPDTLLRTDFKGRIEGITKGIQGGLYTINEGRSREGLPKVANGDTPMLQQQMVPLGWTEEQARIAAAAAPTVVDPVIDEDEDEDEATRAATNFLRKTLNG